MNVCNTILTGTQGSIVSIVTMLWVTQLRNHDTAPGRASRLAVGPIHPPCPLSVGGSFPGGKAAGA
jgi:hypothetical protein